MSRLSFVGKFADTAVTQRMKLSIIILRALAGLALELAHRPLRPRSLGDTFQSPSFPANSHHDCQHQPAVAIHREWPCCYKRWSKPLHCAIKTGNPSLPLRP